MDAKIFRTFLEVANVRHFGRAAENLYLTQAAVSARIKQLESYFNVELFTRDRNNIRLTSAGERLMHYAEIIVSTSQEAKLELSLQSGKALQIKLAGTPSVWDVFLQNALSVVTDSFNNYAFMAEVQSLEQINRKLLERTLDIAFSFDRIKGDELHSEKITDITLILVSTEKKIIDDIFSTKYVYVDWGSRFSSEYTERHPNVPEPYLRTSTSRIALDFILEKGGSAYLPLNMVKNLIKSGDLHQVNNAEQWNRTIYLNYRKNSISIKAIILIKELLIS
ncbi:LysR family transcriptional regulator [Aliivibrio salmonicida]|uniref:LysR family transcriptional regulator n=1 Tax=Aliivibrio salmonicida TaxID=40269 RepID=UPI00406D27E4